MGADCIHAKQLLPGTVSSWLIIQQVCMNHTPCRLTALAFSRWITPCILCNAPHGIPAATVVFIAACMASSVGHCTIAAARPLGLPSEPPLRDSGTRICNQKMFQRWSERNSCRSANPCLHSAVVWPSTPNARESAGTRGNLCVAHVSFS